MTVMFVVGQEDVCGGDTQMFWPLDLLGTLMSPQNDLDSVTHIISR